MNNDHVGTFLSRASILIPIIVLIVGLVSVAQDRFLPHRTISPSPTVSPTAVPKKLTGLNLKGPLVCEYQEKEASSTAFIKNKQIYVAHAGAKESRMLLSGDCAYWWNGNKGTKICGVSGYMSTVEQLTSLGIISVDSMIEMGQEMASQSGLVVPEPQYIKRLLATCEGAEVQDAVFTVPSDVVFATTSAKLP
jgi:hypothetical protein